MAITRKQRRLRKSRCGRKTKSNGKSRYGRKIKSSGKRRHRRTKKVSGGGWMSSKPTSISAEEQRQRDIKERQDRRLIQRDNATMKDTIPQSSPVSSPKSGLAKMAPSPRLTEATLRYGRHSPNY